MELRDYWRTLSRNWVLIVVFTLLGGAIAALVSFLATPQYHSHTQLYVSVHGGQGAANDLVQGSNFAQQAVNSYVQVATSSMVLDQVVNELSLEQTSQDLAKNITATSPSDTVLINIDVNDTDPERAVNIAQTTADVLVDVVENDIENHEGASPVQIVSIQTPVFSDTPVSPKPVQNIAVGLLLGFGIGVGFAFLRGILDRRFQNIGDLELAVSSPVIGRIVYNTEISDRPLVVHADRLSPVAESFRSLRTNLQFVATSEESRVFVVSSSVPNEGKTTTSANLAITLAETGASVILVDADLRKPSIANIMGIEGSVGLTDVLIGQAELQDVLQQWGHGDLAVLPAGRIPPNPSELLGSSMMQNIVEMLSATVDYIIIDTPPILPVTDAVVVSRFAAGVVLVAAAGSTKIPEIQGAIDKLEASGVPLLGVVGTKLPTKGPDANSYANYGYGRQFDENGEQTEPLPSSRRANMAKRGR